MEGLLLRNGGQTGEKAFFSSRRQDGRGGLRTRLCRQPHHLIRWMTCAKDSSASHTATWDQKSVSGRRMVGATTGELEPAVGAVMQPARSQIPDLQRFPRRSAANAFVRSPGAVTSAGGGLLIWRRQAESRAAHPKIPHTARLPDGKPSLLPRKNGLLRGAHLENRYEGHAAGCRAPLPLCW